jgi:AraC-like DNA-binding protein
MDDNHIFNLSRDFFIQYKKRDFEWQMPVFHYHNSYELYFLESGKRSVLINDKLFEINQYDVVLFKPNIYHRNSGGSQHTRTVVNFTNKFLELFFTPQAIKLMLSCFDKNVISLNKKTFETAKDLLIKILNQDGNNKDNSIFAYLSSLLLLLNENKGESAPSLLSSSTKTIVPILSYVSENYKTISNISQISDHFYITKYHLCRIFKEATGLTITQYINDLKVRHACELLNETTHSITDIGFTCGFNSTMYFCKTFKEILQMTPSEFRHNKLNLHQL